MSQITVAELREILQRAPATPLLDVRTPAEYGEVHVPGSTNLPLDRLNAASVSQVCGSTADQPVYLLCLSGGRATRAHEQLAREGVKNTVVVTGGTKAWIEAGLPVDRNGSKAISLERQVRIAAGTLVLTGILLSQILHPAFLGLSAFVGAGLVFAGITDWCGMGLLLAKAPWNQRAP